MIFDCELSVCLFYVVLGGPFRNPQDFVVVSFSHSLTHPLAFRFVFVINNFVVYILNVFATAALGSTGLFSAFAGSGASAAGCSSCSFLFLSAGLLIHLFSQLIGSLFECLHF